GGTGARLASQALRLKRLAQMGLQPLADERDMGLHHRLTIVAMVARNGIGADLAGRESLPAQLGIFIEALAVEHQQVSVIRLRLVGPLGLGVQVQEVLLASLLGKGPSEGQRNADAVLAAYAPRVPHQSRP